MKRFDAAIIGAGPDGLIAAITLARSGLDVVVLEKNAEAGGRARTCEFHPGFRASAFADELPAIPLRLLRGLDLARNGAILMPSRTSLCISANGADVLFSDERAARFSPLAASDGLLSLRSEIETAKAAIAARALAPSTPRRRWFGLRKEERSGAPWPAPEWGRASLAELLGERVGDPGLCLHLAADATSGRAVSPLLAGSALHLLAPGTGRSGMAAGGLGSLGAALEKIARVAGVTLRCNAEVTDIVVKCGEAISLALAGGDEVKARYFLSTLDVKRTFLGLVAWRDLPRKMVRRVGQFRMSGAVARVLFALDAPPVFSTFANAPEAPLGPIHVAASLAGLSLAHDFWQAGVIPETPLVTLRVPSLGDPRLAPVGKAVMTATLSAIPAHLFDGAWTDAKRERLVQIALGAAERAAPGISARVLGWRTIIAEDIEASLGTTAGDFEGGELAPDQALSLRPFQEFQNGRSCLEGLYLGGPSSAPAPFLCGAAGASAALTLLADARAADFR